MLGLTITPILKRMPIRILFIMRIAMLIYLIIWVCIQRIIMHSSTPMLMRVMHRTIVIFIMAVAIVSNEEREREREKER